MDWYKYRTGKAFINKHCGFYSYYINEMVVEFLFPLRKNKQGQIIFEVKDIPLHKYKSMIASGRITELPDLDNPWLETKQLDLFNNI